MELERLEEDERAAPQLLRRMSRDVGPSALLGGV